MVMAAQTCSRYASLARHQRTFALLLVAEAKNVRLVRAPEQSAIDDEPQPAHNPHVIVLV